MFLEQQPTLFCNMGFLQEVLTTLLPMDQLHRFHALQHKKAINLSMLKIQVLAVKKKVGGEPHASIGMKRRI